MLVLAVSNAHERPELLAEQIENYNIAMNGNIFHIININSLYRDAFFEDANKKGISFDRFTNLHFLDRSLEAGYGRLAHVYLRGVQFALRLAINFDYVYFHTPSDLLIKRDVDKYISGFDLGFTKSYPYPFNEQRVFFDHVGRDHWVDAMSANALLFNLLEGLGQATAYRGRTEGSFYRRELFFELVFPWLLESSARDLVACDPPYPQEEAELVSCIEFMRARRSLKQADCLIKVYESNPGHIATVEDVIAAQSDPAVHGVKRLPLDLDSDVRQYIGRIMGRGN